MAGALEERLTGRVIALPETRELDLFADMLERRGALPLRCPLVGILDTPDAAPVEAWLDRCIAGAHDDLILLTGEGLRRLVGFAERGGRREAFVARLAQLRKFTRGPKPARALRELGLRPEVQASEPTTTGLIRDLAALDLKGRRVAVQLYGQEPNRPLMDFLAGAGASTDPVAPYVYADAAADGRVLELVDALAAGKVDAIAFTSSPQVQRLFSVAEQAGRLAELRAGLARCKVAAVGPIVAAVLQERGARADLCPTDSYFLKPLVNELAAALGPAPASAAGG